VKFTQRINCRESGLLFITQTLSYLLGFIRIKKCRKLRSYDACCSKPVGIEISNKAAKLRSESSIKLPDAIVAVTAGANFLITKDDDVIRKIKQAIRPEEFVLKYLQ